MLLKSCRVTNYKCIIDSGEFSICDLTSLVGKNESGKSAILQALYKLNPTDDSNKNYSDIEEYPRSLYSEYEEIKEEAPATVVVTIWELEKKEIEKVEELFGKGILKSNSVIIEKKYNNRTYYTIQYDEAIALNHLKQTVAADEAIKTAVSGADSINSFLQILEDLSKANATVQPILQNILKNIPERKLINGLINIISSYLPVFVYFADYNKLPGQVSVEALTQRVDNKSITFEDKVFLSLLSLVGTTIKDLNNLSTFEKYIAKLESVSIRLTREIFEYWTQNKHLEVDFRFDAGRPADKPPFNTGYVFRTRIRNKRHGVTVSFDERSTGFVWFFSFLVYFSQIKKEYGENVIILLDEPGLSLHAKAQADFLKYVNDKLIPHYQVLYTTHSPFLIDQERLLNVRTVEDKVDGEKMLGTKVSENVLSLDKDTILPLQAALGYEITQSLFIGPYTLLVEGPSDLLYLKYFSKELKKMNRNFLDYRWVIAPSGGIDKISSFVTLFNSQKIEIAIVTDFHKGDKRKIESIRESSILKSSNIYTVNQYVDMEEADIEDMLGRSFYLELINKAYNLKDKHVIQDIQPSDRILKVVEDQFRILPTEIPEFDHYTPSEYLFTNPELKPTNEALDNFEKLFIDLNKVIK